MTIQEWLSKTTASDIMVRRVVTLSPHDTMAHAAEVFLREQISGAPVVTQNGICVGVCSANDLVHAEEVVLRERAKVAESSLWNTSLALPVAVYEQKLAEVRDKIAPAAEQPVERFMTTNLVSVRETEPVLKVVTAMVEAHIHRVVVVDASNRLLGIVSTTDILAALLKPERSAK
jgi:CBS domain-containing protein